MTLLCTEETIRRGGTLWSSQIQFSLLISKLPWIAASSSCSPSKVLPTAQTSHGTAEVGWSHVLKTITHQRTSLATVIFNTRATCQRKKKSQCVTLCGAHKLLGSQQTAAWQQPAERTVLTMRVATTWSIFLLRSSGSPETARVSSSSEGRAAKVLL